MKKTLKTLAAGLGVAAMVFSTAAMSRDTKHLLPLDQALNTADAKEKLNAGIKFYFAGQKTPKVGRSMIEVVTNKKTNAFGKSDEDACNWVFLSAMIALQDRAVREGGDAVVDIVSYYKKDEMKSASEYECHAGGIMAGVALKGRIVKLAK